MPAPLTLLEWLSFAMGAVTVWRYGHSKRQGAICGIATALLFMLWGALAGLYGAVTINIGFLLLHANNLRRSFHAVIR
ncbi:MAG: hypothetical protein ACK4NA_12630 [Alphaproteobacteria bacterium]